MKNVNVRKKKSKGERLGWKVAEHEKVDLLKKLQHVVKFTPKLPENPTQNFLIP